MSQTVHVIGQKSENERTLRMNESINNENRPQTQKTRKFFSDAKMTNLYSDELRLCNAEFVSNENKLLLNLLNFYSMSMI